ncbi:MAG: glutathione S-transferase [Alphaproteobacteria bacterium]
MKLFFAPLSPFVRKVRIAAMELGLNDRIDLIDIMSSPVAMNPELGNANPLGKLPSLINDDGDVIFDSAVIVDYLDSLAGGGKLIPASGPARWRTKTTEALADGMADAAILMRYEQALRPADKQWADWSAGQNLKVTQALDALEKMAPQLGDKVDASTIAIGCAVGYLDIRFGDMGWRKTHPKLGAWFDKFAQRKSFQATKPAT